jgi:cellulose synthase/poly-beta-1,6-N-acetylglucosamine synthase-like glycosyltransferase
VIATFSRLLFWAGIAWGIYVYVGYPAILYLLSQVRRFKPVFKENYLPAVSVLISARNEAKDIGWKVRETLNWNYPPEKLEVLVANDDSTDATSEELDRIVDARLKAFHLSQRSGKNAALNFLSKNAKGELLFFTDANSQIGPDCLRRTVRYFSDPRVGCVTGVERSASEGLESATAQGGGAYLRYEGMINTLESQIGSVLVCDGSVFCSRSSLLPELHPDLANDLQQPLYIGAHGYKLLYDPEIYSSEVTSSSPKEEFKRRRRICGQGFLGMWRMRASLTGIRGWQFISRKFLRWLMLIPMLMVLVGSYMLRDQPGYFAALAIQIMFYVLVFIGWASARFEATPPRIVSFPLFFVLVNLAAFVGVIETCFGRRFATWDTASLSRGKQQSSAVSSR